MKFRLASVCTALLLVSVQLFAPIAALVPAAGASPLCVIDTAGANDEPGQKDLTQLCVDYANKPTSIQTSWNWDELGTTGNNTMDACSLFDTNGDGNINYSVCVTTENTPATLQTVTTYSCGDAKFDRCTSQTTVISNGSTTCIVGQQNTDPFNGTGNKQGDAYPYDTVGTCTIDLSAVGGSSAKLIDVCSYPSSEPNSDPSDCVIARSNTAKLEVVKSLAPSTDSGRFDLKIGSTTYATNVGDGGTTGTQVMSASSNGTSYTVYEAATASTNTSLGNYSTTAVCKDLHGTGTTLASNSSLTGSNTRQLTVSVKADSDVVCTFTNTRSTGNITVTKRVINDNGGQAVATAFPLYVNQTQVTSGAGSSFNSGVSYAVSENGGPSGYKQTSLTCVDSSTNSALTNPFTLTAGQNVSCVIVNDDQPGTLVVKKLVTNNNGGTKSAPNFSFSVNGGAATPFNANGENDLSVNAGTYSVTETADSGYAASYDSCSNVVIANGGTATCTITNDDVAPSLTLTKLVSNDHGGTAKPSDWTLTATGPTTISGQGGVVSDSTFSAGTYTLSESGSPTGYSASDWTCTGATVNNSQITLINGQTASCTITNSDVDPILTIIKEVLNPYGTPLPVSSFPLFVDAQSVTSGVPTTQFSAGTHTVTETQQAGYILTGVSGDCTLSQGVISLPLAIGGTSTCTLTNTAIQPKLIVKKVVVNDNGGTAQSSDFTMTVSGNSAAVANFPGNENGTTIYLNEGNYSVDELSHYGYTETLGTDCSGTISIGETKTCTVTNDDIAPTLTINKQATPSTDQSFNFTSPNLGNFALTGDDSSSSSTTFTVQHAGQVTFTEQPSDNWATAAIWCDNERFTTDVSTLTVDLSVGNDVNCYVFNTEQNTVTGHKFNDVNDNHQWDSGEPTLKNWTITLTGCTDQTDQVLPFPTNSQATTNCTSSVSRTTTTDASGAYSFDGLEPGTYTVCEVQQPTWTQTYPQTNNGCHAVTFDAEDYGVVVTKDFGNHPDPQVLGSSTTTTPKLLVNTGMEASRNLFVGLVILGALGALHVATGRRQTTSR